MSFNTTRWSVIAAARGPDPDAARAALSTLCEAYWYPLYAFIRRWGAGAASSAANPTAPKRAGKKE